ncbi:amino acid decarboxylase [Ornithinibacillus sp. L9]|uniref:Amino acid decarboxylase n=1 Tax=Ornithinibacillus caprae TaxID=2678566 RepID=A0A6N8FJV0_9BACI|nr:amino acid decarboxylase [Ornithinibacillus caprae]MUK89471.1 amino acid decarboxylase [Ornithinibacillus caprae]
MLEVKTEGQKAIIDVRERILNGEHPRNEIFDYVKTAPVGTIFEIHLPRRGQPVINGLESFGMNVVVDEVEAGHFRLVAVKLKEIGVEESQNLADQSFNDHC